MFPRKSNAPSDRPCFHVKFSTIRRYPWGGGGGGIFEFVPLLIKEYIILFIINSKWVYHSLPNRSCLVAASVVR